MPEQAAPLAVSILGLEQAGFLPSQPEPSQTRNTMPRGPARSDRRMTSYFNPFQSRCAPSNDSPPSYTSAQNQIRLASSPRHLDNGREILPRYTCSVQHEGPMHMLLESCSPFTLLPCQEWREVYIVVQGTQMSVHKLKSSSYGDKKMYTAGRLLRKYTLQQAEVGMAPDITYSVLVPLTRMASLIPSIARKRAVEKDPQLFAVEKQYSLRMRAELDQFVLACPREETSFQWIHTICSGIDIAAPLDERSVPRQCTMPRRRRRQQRAVINTDLTDRRFILQQERILRSMYPAFADDGRVGTLEIPAQDERPVTSDYRVEGMNSPAEQEAEDVDLSALAEEMEPALAPQVTRSQRPTTRRQTTPESVVTLSAIETFSTDPINLDINGKWNPPHPQTSAQQLRYTRRCMPILLEETPRHTNVMINAGKYVRPNWKTDSLEEWSLKPPTYDAHEFPQRSTPMLARRATQTSVGSSQSRSASGSGDEVQRVDSPAMTQGDLCVPALKLENSHGQKQSDVSITVTRSPALSCESKKALQQQELRANLVLMGF